MNTLIPRLPVTKAVRTLLELSGKPVDIGRVPRDATTDEPVEPPYFILYPLWGSRSGTWSHPQADAEFTYQVRMVSKNPTQLEWLYDKAVELVADRDAVTGAYTHALTVTGLSVMQRRLSDEDAGVMGRDDAAATLSYDVRFTVAVTEE